MGPAGLVVRLNLISVIYVVVALASIVMAKKIKKSHYEVKF